MVIIIKLLLNYEDDVTILSLRLLNVSFDTFVKLHLQGFHTYIRYFLTQVMF